MTSASKSVYYFGFYLAFMAIILVAVPNTILELFQLPTTTEVWIRALGVVVLNMGILYIFMAANNNVLFMTLSVYLRVSVLLWFILFVALEMAPVRLIAFGIVDATGAAWTYFALRKSQS